MKTHSCECGKTERWCYGTCRDCEKEHRPNEKVPYTKINRVPYFAYNDSAAMGFHQNGKSFIQRNVFNKRKSN